MALTQTTAAFTPFLNEFVRIRAPRTRNEYVEPVVLHALVMESAPYDLSNGIGSDATAVEWVVCIPSDAIPDATAIRHGATVEASNMHPELFVHKAHPVGPILHLECSTTGGR